MKKWTETTALNYLNSQGIGFKGKYLLVPNGFNGLTACSARDYLINHCNYKQVGVSM